MKDMESSFPVPKELLHNHSLCGLCFNFLVQLLMGRDKVSSGRGCMHSLSLPTRFHHLENGCLSSGKCTMEDMAIMGATRPAGNNICKHT